MLSNGRLLPILDIYSCTLRDRRLGPELCNAVMEVVGPWTISGA